MEISGAGLPKTFIDDGHKWLEMKNPMYVIAAESLKQADAEFFSQTLLNPLICKKMNPSKWWESASENIRLPKGLVQLAKMLMSLPSSSAGIERDFSTLANIMTKQRNRIGIEKASKLCLVHRYLRVNLFFYLILYFLEGFSIYEGVAIEACDLSML